MIIQFQYNPETLTRSLTASAVNPQGNTLDSLRLHGTPRETIQLEALLDATDALENAGHEGDDGSAQAYGIYPALSALELLLYPSSARMILNAALADVGIIEVIPGLPLPTLFVWGPRRVLAVRLNSFQVTEEQHDADLNPIRARVALGMQVLTYEDLGMISVGGVLSLRNHIQKEALVSSSGKFTQSAALSLYNDAVQQGESELGQASNLSLSSQLKVF
jgi:hypothetical protein